MKWQWVESFDSRRMFCLRRSFSFASGNWISRHGLDWRDDDQSRRCECRA